MNSRWVIQLTDRRAYAARFERRQRRWVRSVLHAFALDIPALPQNDNALTAVGESLADGVRKVESSPLTCRLIIPASWCLIHGVELPAGKFSEQAAEYAFEQFLPLELEALTCAVHRVDRRRAVVAGVFTEALRGLLTTLESNGVYPEIVAIDAFLLNAVDAGAADDRRTNLLLTDDRHFTLVTSERVGGRVVDIRTVILPAENRDAFVARQLAVTSTTTAYTVGDWTELSLRPSDTLSEFEEVPLSYGLEAEPQSRFETVDALLAAAADDRGVPNLRTGALAFSGRWSALHKRARRCLQAGAVVLLALGLQLRLDNVAFSRAAERLRPARDEIYASAIPGNAIPSAPALRLRSERIKLEGMTRHDQVAGLEQATTGLAAFELLHEVMARIPSELKLDVQQIDLDAGGVRLAGRTTGHSAAGQLVKHLGSIPRVTVDPPRTKLRKDGTVDFRIRIARASGDD